MTIQRPVVLAQRRSYAYQPMTLTTNEVYRKLTHCQFAATRAFNIISTEWNREDEEAMSITFSAHDGGEEYIALCIRRVMGCDDDDEEDEEAYQRFILQQPGWSYGCKIVRAWNEVEVDEEYEFAHLKGRAVTIEDVRPAIKAVFMAVWHASTRIARTDDPCDIFGETI